MIPTAMRWRAVSLVYMYSVPIGSVASVFGVSQRSIKRWLKFFNDYGTVTPQSTRAQRIRWQQTVFDFVDNYIKYNPCFYVEELQTELIQRFPEVTNFSLSTICRALKENLGLTRKKLEKRAKESQPHEREDFFHRLRAFYLYPEQLVFVDETSKDGRDAQRSMAWALRGQRAIVQVPFIRGSRVSALASFNCTGFLGRGMTDSTFTRGKFHEVFKTKILPKLNPWPLPNSIVILDNARIHIASGYGLTSRCHRYISSPLFSRIKSY